MDLISDGNKTTVFDDAILPATGRTPNVKRMNLEAVGVDCSAESGSSN